MTRFFQLSGSGNDFLALAEPSDEPTAEQVRAWCRRGVSLGADGVFTLHRNEAAADKAAGAVMIHYNADGSRAELCLNGTRCAARLAFELGWAQREVTVETDSGPMVARALSGARVALAVPPPAAPPRRITLSTEGRDWDGWRVVVGVPHLVLLWPEPLAAAPVASLGARLRHHPDLAPAGANVDFVRFPAAGRMEIRTYERGVEAETLACGTGTLAAAAAGLAAGVTELPLEVVTRGGLPLGVGGTPDRWELAGDARLLARGELFRDAEVSPSPPATLPRP